RRRRNTSFPCATMAWASTRLTRTNCLASSSACTRRTNFPARALDSRLSAAWSRDTAAKSGPREKWAGERRFTFHCRRRWRRRVAVQPVARKRTPEEMEERLARQVAAAFLLCTLTFSANIRGANVRFAIIGDYGVDDSNERDVANLVATNFQPDFIV